jgi:hypothetical protein
VLRVLVFGLEGIVTVRATPPTVPIVLVVPQDNVEALLENE